jgi:hypothetical protein
MKKLFNGITLLASMMAAPVMAHLGHDHAAIYAAGESHPVSGSEPLVMVALTMLALYLVLKAVRK